MSSPSRTLKLTYLGDASQLRKENENLEGDFGKLGDNVKKFGKVAAAAFAAAGAAAIVVGKKLFDAAERAGTANARIEQITISMGNFGDEASEVASKVAGTANELAKLTGVERNTIKETQALLLTFNRVNRTADETGGVFERATEAAIDLAAAGFGSATSNAQSLGRALEDPIRGLTSLTRQGVTFTDAERERIETLVESNQVQEAQVLILEAIEKQVGGTAEATSNASDRIRQSFGVIVDQIALSLAPQFEKLTDAVGRLIDRFAEWWQDNGPRVIEVIGNTVEAARNLWGFIRERLDPVIQTLIETIRNLITRATEFWQNNAPRFVEILDRLRSAGGNVAEAFREIFQPLKNVTEEFRREGRQGSGTNKFVELLVLVAKIMEALSIVVFDLTKPLRDVTQTIERIANSRTVAVLRALVDLAYGPQGLGVRQTPALAGATTGPLVGLQGPARPLPPSVQGPRQGTINNITVNGATDPESVARQLRRILDDSDRRSGPTQRLVFTP